MDITIEEMHRKLDRNGDKMLQKHEFVEGLSKYNISDLRNSDYGIIFDALDINHDGELSLDEFAMFLEGAKKSRDNRLRQMDPETLRQLEQEVG